MTITRLFLYMLASPKAAGILSQSSLNEMLNKVVFEVCVEEKGKLELDKCVIKQ